MRKERFMKLQEWRNRICENSFLNELYPLCAGRAAEGAERLLGLLDYFNETFGPEGDISLFSAPGRTGRRNMSEASPPRHTPVSS